MTKSTSKTKKNRLARTLSAYEFLRLIPDEQAAIDYLSPILWPKGPTCPYCGSHRHNLKTQENYYFCKDCRKDYTIRVNTIFHRSHIPLNKWLFAMYLVVTARKGISSLQLSKELGITYKTAWFLAHRIRTACGSSTRRLLSGMLECDETYLGGKETNKHSDKKLNSGRGAVGKTPVFGIMTRNGQIITQPVIKTDSETLQRIIGENARLGSTICTDDNKAYIGLERKYEHKKVNHSAKQFVDGMAHTNSIESVWAVLKRSFYGTYHNFSAFHTNLYLNECTFRLNQGNVKYPTLSRIQSLTRGVSGKRLTYRGLIHGRMKPKSNKKR